MSKLRFLGAIKSDNQLEGYFIVDEETGKSVPKTLKELKYLVKQRVEFTNAKYDFNTDTFVGTDGSLNRLPIFDRANCVFDRNTITILGVLIKCDLRYFKVMNEYGKIVVFREDKLLGYLSVQNIVLTNAKLVMKDSKVIISAIKGTFPSMDIKEFNKYVSSNKPKAGRVPEKVTQEPTKTRDTNNIENVSKVTENNVLVKPDKKYFFGSIEWKSKLFIDRISDFTSKAGNITIRRGINYTSRANTLRKITNYVLSVEGSRSNTKKKAFTTDIKKLRNNTAYYYSRCITQRTILPILFGDIEYLCRVLLARGIADSWNEYVSKVRQREMVIQEKKNKNRDLFISLCKNDYALLKEYYSKMQKGEYVPRDIYFSCKILFEGYKINTVPDYMCNDTSKLTNEECFNLYWKYKVEQYDAMSRVNVRHGLIPVRGYSKLSLSQTRGLIARDETHNGNRGIALVSNKALELMDNKELYAEEIKYILNLDELKKFISKLKEYVYTGANAFITLAIKGYYKEDKANELLSNFSKFYDKIPQDMENRADEAKALNEYMNYFVLACIIKDKELSNGESYDWIKRNMKGNSFKVTLPELQEVMSAKNIVF